MNTKCTICPKGCELAPGETGDCRVRKNIKGRIECITYGHPCAIQIDPIEKKPLYHVLPGSSVLSIGTAGCNLHCKQCQNASISQSVYISPENISPLKIAEQAIAHKTPAIAYTYTEPLVSYEFTLDCCIAAHDRNIKNLLVTAAFINPEPLRKISAFIDAANVDLKSFSDDFYRKICGARLHPILKAMKIMKECGVFLEITNLLIPTLNDSEEETKLLSEWIVHNLGAYTPLHLSRFFPQNQLQHLPPTPSETILRARDIAIQAGLKFVYVGNMQDGAGESTWCPECGTCLIKRKGFQISAVRISDGKCPECGSKIYGIWN
ncbi:AmmeMemoRadiSam system radical SAM enzyme [Pontiella agarivorans]|uniref:AmmeMemoRadiSam system radical SAM enzyme n=1 Tax=Pontiella agarivorans TaxID=3038953 RepID=A0ABU5MWR3_9BACT|nr:AmmeMemoRadiSam system radical SAM enzyme [Pontiella agarivorans]MDZ8118577.1 AmmeMemoRadiSam system radical SAM enzyme [Pontiella agarivorans]